MAHGTPEQDGTHMMDEPDIGSGGKTPAERDTDEQIKTIPPVPANGAGKAPGAGQPPPGKDSAPGAQR